MGSRAKGQRRDVCKEDGRCLWEGEWGGDGPVCADRRELLSKARVFSCSIYLAGSQAVRSSSCILASLPFLLVFGAVRRVFLKFWVDPVVCLNVLQCLCFPRVQGGQSGPSFPSSPLSLQLGSVLRAKPVAQLPWKDLPLLLLSL